MVCTKTNLSPKCPPFRIELEFVKGEQKAENIKKKAKKEEQKDKDASHTLYKLKFKPQPKAARDFLAICKKCANKTSDKVFSPKQPSKQFEKRKTHVPHLKLFMTIRNREYNGYR